mmetsp:Transcript_18664/g.36535  ORF Transcript_18664/g.36535 Transcript_18664/m.36535 type:complete len:135 (+) Transcript_18664:1212-1616(+)
MKIPRVSKRDSDLSGPVLVLKVFILKLLLRICNSLQSVQRKPTSSTIKKCLRSISNGMQTNRNKKFFLQTAPKAKRNQLSKWLESGDDCYELIASILLFALEQPKYRTGILGAQGATSVRLCNEKMFILGNRGI